MQVFNTFFFSWSERAFLVEKDLRLQGPASRGVLDGVASASWESAVLGQAVGLSGACPVWRAPTPAYRSCQYCWWLSGWWPFPGCSVAASWFSRRCLRRGCCCWCHSPSCAGVWKKTKLNLTLSNYDFLLSQNLTNIFVFFFPDGQYFLHKMILLFFNKINIKI